MHVNRVDTAPAVSNLLGAYLRDRRARLNPAELGLTTTRRRTPGLRRAEVAARANISPAWYTWLEQGRGGAPSPDVLDRIADGLVLNEAEREHLFFLAFGRAPQVTYRPADAVTPRVQRLLDAMESTPAFIRTATWDVIAWNKAATLVMFDYAALAPHERNILRLIFREAPNTLHQEDQGYIAKLVVNTLRADMARTGAMAEVDQLVTDLCATSAAFRELWTENDVRLDDNGVVRLDHPSLGPIELEHFSFGVDGRADLGMVVHNPVDPAMRERIRALVTT
jgi:transcriptional regulator with XRE-family HTH domain